MREGFVRSPAALTRQTQGNGKLHGGGRMGPGRQDFKGRQLRLISKDRWHPLRPGSIRYRSALEQPLPYAMNPDSATLPLIDVCLPLRWRDLDAYDHVNNSVFLTLLEEARIRWFASLPGPWRSSEGEPVVASIHMEFRRPINYPAEVRVRLWTERVGNSSLTLRHALDDGADASIRYGDGRSVLVWVDPTSGKPCALPAMVRSTAMASSA